MECKKNGNFRTVIFSGMVRVVFRINTENSIKIDHLKDNAKDRLSPIGKITRYEVYSDGVDMRELNFIRTKQGLDILKKEENKLTKP